MPISIELNVNQLPSRDWRRYEEQIGRRLQQMAGPNAEVMFNQKITGRISHSIRQVDILVKGAFAGALLTGVTMAVDCKCWGRRVTVDDVDGFAGFIQDVGTDLGLLVTTRGHSHAALARAVNSGLRLDIVPYDELETWRPLLVTCPVCTDPKSDRFPGMAWLRRPLTDVPGKELVTGISECEMCSTPIWMCGCGTANPVLEYQVGEWARCEGCWEIEAQFHQEYDRKGSVTGESWKFQQPEAG